MQLLLSTVQAANVTVTGDLTVNGTTTTLDTDLIGVDKLEAAANNTTVAAAITQTGSGDILNLYDGGTEVFSVLDGGAVRIGGNAVSGAAAGVVLQDVAQELLQLDLLGQVLFSEVIHKEIILPTLLLKQMVNYFWEPKLKVMQMLIT